LKQKNFKKNETKKRRRNQFWVKKSIKKHVKKTKTKTKAKKTKKKKPTCCYSEKPDFGLKKRKKNM